MKKKLKKQAKKKERVIVRKFAYKLGQPNFSSANFSIEITDTCPSEDTEKMSKELDEECQAEVRKSIAAFLAKQKAKVEAEVKAEKNKALGKSDKKAAKAEKKEVAKDVADHDMGDIEVVQSESEEYINAN